MRRNTQDLNTAALANLLTNAFMNVKDLRRFCRESEFRPVLELVSESESLREHVDVLISYCETRLLFDELLAGVQRDNPRQYDRFAPGLYDRSPVGHEDPVTPSQGDGTESLARQPVTTAESSIATTPSPLRMLLQELWLKVLAYFRQ